MSLKAIAKRYSDQAACPTHDVEAAFLSGAEVGWKKAWAIVRERLKRNRRSAKGLSEEVCSRLFEEALGGGGSNND